MKLKRKRGKIIRSEPVFNLFLRLPLDTALSNHSPSTRFLNAAAAVAQAFARSGSFAPELVTDQEGNFLVRYTPLIYGEETAAAVDYLAKIMPPGFIFRKEDKRVLASKDGACEVVALLLSHLVNRFANIEKDDKLCNAFFKGAVYPARGFEEKQTAKSITGWLERLHLRARDVSPVVRIEPPAGRKKKFKLTARETPYSHGNLPSAMQVVRKGGFHWSFEKWLQVYSSSMSGTWESPAGPLPTWCRVKGSAPSSIRVRRRAGST